MSKRMLILVLTVTLAMFLMVACSFQDGSDEVEQTPDGVEQNDGEEDSDEVAADRNDQDDMNDDNENNAEDPSEEVNNSRDQAVSDSNVSDDQNLPAPIVINEKIQHPNGITFTLDQITFSEDYITVHIDVFNGRGRPVRLAEYMKESERIHKEGAILVDDTGYEYTFIAPEGEPRISVGEGEKMTGAITFIGQLSEDATALSLTFNPEYSEEDPNTDSPKFEFKDIQIER